MSRELTDIGYVRGLLQRHGTRTKKGLGQNFIVNPSVCPRMAGMCGAKPDGGALEIGCGVGVLTRELSRVAGKVVCVELDASLFPVLGETLEGFGNVELVQGDILKVDLDALIREKFGDMPVAVCANLPYYITTPVLMRLLEYGNRFTALTLMVQKEFAQRLAAKPGSSSYGALTVSAAYRAKTELLFGVSAGSFMPPPKVDSAVIRLTPYAEPPVKVKDEALFFAVVRAAFGQRRKMLSNALGSAFGRERALAALNAAGIPPTARGETLSVEKFAAIADGLRSEIDASHQ